MSLITTQFYKVVNQFSDKSQSYYLFAIAYGSFNCNQIINLINLKHSNVMAWADMVFDDDENEVIIKWIETHPQYRNKGYAKQVLRAIIAFAKQKGYYRIILDDMSDNYMSEHNLYKSVGFHYIEDGQPEMELILT
jgi:GNAT superfamily N-acetyltransferase